MAFCTAFAEAFATFSACEGLLVGFRLVMVRKGEKERGEGGYG